MHGTTLHAVMQRGIRLQIGAEAISLSAYWHSSIIKLPAFSLPVPIAVRVVLQCSLYPGHCCGVLVEQSHVTLIFVSGGKASHCCLGLLGWWPR